MSIAEKGREGGICHTVWASWVAWYVGMDFFFGMKVYTAAPVASGWARAVMVGAGAVMVWEGAVEAFRILNE